MTSASYTYKKDGIRTSKTLNEITTTYTLVDSRVTQETDGTNNIYYRYDSNNSLISMNLNGTEYYYFFDAQGDVVGLFDNNGAMVVEYAYDAWGNLTFEKDGQGLDKRGDSTFIGNINPYRYRGYRFDNESGLYYLQSRYYNSAWGRFINEDATMGFLGAILTSNMFTYCLNNPIYGSDPTGYMSGAVAAGYLSIDVYLYLSSSEIAIEVAAALTPILTAIFWWCVVIVAAIVITAIAYITIQAHIAQAVQNITNKVRKNSPTRYWGASLGIGCVNLGKPLTYAQAVNEVASGRSVFAVTRAEAEAVARAAGGGATPVFEVSHKNQPGYYNHYHPTGHASAHLWYLFG